MHTPLCGHAVGELIEYAMRAAELGIDLITFTCHIPMESAAFGQEGIRMRREQLDDYFALVADAAAAAKPFGVEVLCGIEAEVFPDEAELEPMDAILSAYHFDFVLGSLHAQCQSYLEWLSRNKVTSDAMRIDSYFRHLRDGAQSGRYDSMSHPDVIRTYGVVREFNPVPHEEVIREFLQAVVEEDICMEVNTSGLNKGDFEVHPDPVILDWASEMGVKLTIGSDSHMPNSVGQHFDWIQPMLRDKGFTDLHYFRGRQRVRIDMPQ
ncbi:MAG: histidinol-phosphatase HisJ family protein [Verrucomicrobia bacterium]|jgi:histidinol-phosphatase (PHP family)|nr:histidinol-phosphatase HisJ family protein [Verrucomicrobiota bacterium]